MRIVLAATARLPPVCNDAPNSGTDHVTISATAIKAFIAAKYVVDIMVRVIINAVPVNQMELIKTVLQRAGHRTIGPAHSFDQGVPE